MVVPLIVLAVLLVAAVVVLFLRSQALTTARADIAGLEQRVSGLEGELATTITRATTAEANAGEASARADAQAKRTAEATTAQKAATARAEAEARRAAASESAADSASALADAATARAEKGEAQLRVLPPEGLWALESRRISRLWRERVSVTLDGPSPLVDAADPALEAVRVLTGASREESGVVVDLTWTVDPVPDPLHAVALVRLTEELIATARLADGAELAVSIEADQLVLRLSTDSAIGSPTDLVDALAQCGWKTEILGRTIVVHVPAT